MFSSHSLIIPPSYSVTLRYGFIGLSLLLLASFMVAITPIYAADKPNIVPCNVKLEFGMDNNGMSIVSYNLEMQISNQDGRTIRGVSVHWLNAQSEIIGNSDATCGTSHDGIKQAQSGSCRRTIQKIGGHLLNRLGQETWTNIINSEVRAFQAVRYCAIIGYRFGEPTVNRY